MIHTLRSVGGATRISKVTESSGGTMFLAKPPESEVRLNEVTSPNLHEHSVLNLGIFSSKRKYLKTFFQIYNLKSPLILFLFPFSIIQKFVDDTLLFETKLA